ncbi:MAG TPA: ABC transporter permease [Candidatus Krumholzibacteria bacterium]|nr:ABC transporter permease [Candidatus Krumholzibacteria bacterium]
MRPSFRVVLEGVRIAFHALLANKLRTFLTLLGNIVGIMSVIAVVSLLGGIDLYMRTEVASEGSNLFTIRRVNFFEAIEDFEKFVDKLLYNPQLTRNDAAALRESLEHARYVSARVEQSAVKVSAHGKSVEVEVAGCDAYYPFVNDIPLAEGRHVTEVDDRENAQVVLLGWDVYNALFAPRDGVGATVRIGNRHFRVVGVAAQRGRVLGQSRDRFVVVPLGAFHKLFGPEQSVQIQVVADDIRNLEHAMEEATVAMRIRHGLGPREENDFAVSSSEQLINLWKSISRGVMTALVALVGVSMLVGGIVLMNTMVVSVTERTREVGLRKAVGAPQGAIMWQFLVESATLSVFGGVAGMAIGFSIAAIVSAVSVLPYVVNAALVGIALAVTIALGLVFGTYPALRAARLDPVEALRSE